MISAASTLAASEKFDLDRVAPVPATEPVPIVDFFRAPLFSDPKLNPSGTHFAALVESGTDHTAMLICDLSKLQINQVQGGRNKDFYSIDWLDQTHLLTSLLSDKLYAEGLFIIDVSRKNENYMVESYSATSLVGVPTAAPMKPLIWIRRNAYDEGRDGGVVQLNAKNRLGAHRDALPGSMQEQAAREETDLYGTRASIVQAYPPPTGLGVVVNYLADKNGELAFSIMVDRGIYTLYRLESGRWKTCPVDLDAVYPLAVGDQPNELIVVGPREEGRPRAVQRIDAATGVLGEVLLQDKAYDVTACSVYRHPVTKIVLGIKFSRSRLMSVWFDENYRAIQKILEGFFPKQVVQILGSDNEENRFFVCAYSDRQPVAYYTLDLHTRVLGLIKSTAPWIDAERMQATNVLKFKTRDGRSLDAYLTLPAGASKEKPAPLVVLPHGGPWVRDSWGFDSEAQFLASRGYAVFQPNYRGSPGYNWMFPTDDEWAFRKMHDDVTYGVKAVIRTGFVDATRMAIMGTSFGGYLAACGAAFEPNLYRCAVTVSGVFDWAQVIKDARFDQYSSAEFGILRRNLGDPKSKQADFDSFSPLRHIGDAKIPFFVAHGGEDEVVSISESRALIAELKKSQLPCEVMLVGGEGHGMHHLKNRVELYARIEAFLAKNLAAPTANVAAASGAP